MQEEMTEFHVITCNAFGMVDVTMTGLCGVEIEGTTTLVNNQTIKTTTMAI